MRNIFLILNMLFALNLAEGASKTNCDRILKSLTSNNSSEVLNRLISIEKKLPKNYVEFLHSVQDRGGKIIYELYDDLLDSMVEVLLKRMPEKKNLLFRGLALDAAGLENIVKNGVQPHKSGRWTGEEGNIFLSNDPSHSLSFAVTKSTESKKFMVFLTVEKGSIRDLKQASDNIFVSKQVVVPKDIFIVQLTDSGAELIRIDKILDL